MDISKILTGVKEGKIGVSEAEAMLKYKPYEELNYAVIDYHREIRNGCPEVIYGASKTVMQVYGIVENMKKNGATNILATRASHEMYEAVLRIYPEAKYSEEARLISVDIEAFPKNKGLILVITAGTSDIPVAEEAALTAEFLGNNVQRLYDMGVAGLHRILSKLEKIQEASVIIVAAGMEGALASVIGGLTDKPVVAVPTSVGYGASLNGIAALLSMLNSCASGVGVVNIDNGFGAGYLAHSINKLKG